MAHHHLTHATRRAALALLAAALLLAGCGQADTPQASSNADATSCATPQGLVLVVGVHRNEPAPGVPVVLACPLGKAIGSRRPVAVVADDGNPFVTLSATVLPVSTANAAAWANDTRAEEDRVLAAVASAKARTPGADLLGALSVAADEARSAGIAHPTIAVIDSGLSDRGLINFTEPGMLGADPAQIARFVAAQGALPDLRGASVDLIGLGYTTAPQPPLDAAQRVEVDRIWAAVASAAGASVEIVPFPRSGPGPRTALPTGIVEVPAVEAFQPEAGQTTIFDDTSPLGFYFDSTQLRDPADAQAELRPMAAWLAAAPGRRATLVGTTDSIGSPAYNKALSLARANRIAQLLISLGAPPAAISTQGAGYTADPPDLTPTGSVDPAKAALNRAVRITLQQ
jgi:outer membrane protein OmpA-like peptidoglycan-associated protein